jgi:nicotinamide-nucleotide amidase
MGEGRSGSEGENEAGCASEAAGLEAEARRLAGLLVAEARERSVTLGCAESLTGGLIAGAITSVAGSSEVMLGGVVSYAVSVKHAVLGVDQRVLDGVGPVSRECAAQMAEGARRVLGSDIAVAVTGIAGPGGTEPGKPVGTVWFGLATPGGTRCERMLFDGDRTCVRLRTVCHALGLLREGVKEF